MQNESPRNIFQKLLTTNKQIFENVNDDSFWWNEW